MRLNSNESNLVVIQIEGSSDGAQENVTDDPGGSTSGTGDDGGDTVTVAGGTEVEVGGRDGERLARAGKGEGDGEIGGAGVLVVTGGTSLALRAMCSETE